MKKNFKKLIRTVQKNWRLAAVVIILTTISGYLLANYGLTKHYLTTAEIYVESLDNETANQKTATCALLFTSPQMYNTINETLVSGFSYEEYENMIKVEQKSNSQIISITVDCDNSEASFKLMNKYLELIPKVIESYKANAQIKIVRNPEQPVNPAFPDEELFTLIGAITGAVLSLIAILLIWRLDNTISPLDDLAEEYGINILGEIADFDYEIDYLGR